MILILLLLGLGKYLSRCVLKKCSNRITHVDHFDILVFIKTI